MPRPPDFAPIIARRRPSPYSTLAERVARRGGEVYRLNVGDTWMEPAPGCRMEDLTVAEHPGMHRYAPIQGIPALREVIAARVVARTGVPTTPAEVLIGAGVTGLLDAIARALIAPGDEALILSPHWPLVSGVVEGAHGVAVRVPFHGVVHDPKDIAPLLERHVTPRTVALYLNTPSNPTGLVLPDAWLRELVAFARRHDLWLWADEVYEDYVYRGEHVWTRPLAPERTLSLHSFSKAYGMAGNRCGYLVAPVRVIEQVLKASTFTYYSTPTAAQLAAIVALGPPGDAWIAHARDAYRALGEAAAARLRVPAPDGCTFLFLDVSDALDREFGPGPAEGGDDPRLMRLLERCADQGVLVAPGPSFGPYPRHVRVCFTAEPPEKTTRGIDRLAEVLGR
ncbi:MAG: pyridoxal phosphate-dependent aminotransferase [Nannocystaceae bacterium]|nr:pyridoxal phosphate-dependent aminotransferase [Myxococcales bacterium]